MIMKIERDQRRFRQIVRGRIRKNLRKYITHGEMIGRKGRDLVSIPGAAARRAPFPLRRERGRRRRAGRRRRGPADRQAAAIRKDGSGQAGSDPGGGHLLEVDISLEELAEILGDELELPRIQPKGQATIVAGKDPSTTASARRARSRCGTSSAPICKALRRQITTGVYEPDDPRVIPIKADKQYRSWNDHRAP